MKESSFITIKNVSIGKLVIKKSTFLSFAIPVDNVTTIECNIKELRKTYHDARHICYAYVISPEGQNFRASDGGEPSGTAGRPILSTIRSKALTNVLVAVVRYFGGIKLGTSGLIAAYKQAAEEALNQAVFVTCKIEDTINMTFNYTSLNDVMHILKHYEAKILSKQIDSVCSFSFKIDINFSQEVKQQLSKILSLQFIE
jgi:uncharacterized YigZ family protein